MTLLFKALSGLFLATIWISSGCKKNIDPTKSAVLPPATQEGKNTVGFTINGEAWMPYAKCRFGADPCGEISANYSYPFAAQNGIGFQFARFRNNKSSSLTIYTLQTNSITTIGSKIDSIGVEYAGENSNGTDGEYLGPRPGRNSKFIITKIDHQNQIISGEFEFVLLEQNGSGREITLKDGRFDFKFNACKCSN